MLESGLRQASVLTRLFMLLDTAILIALLVGSMLVQAGSAHGWTGMVNGA